MKTGDVILKCLPLYLNRDNLIMGKDDFDKNR